MNSHLCNAQILDGGQNPPGLKWREINTGNFKVLYPTSLETEAQRIANSLDFFMSKISRTLNKKPSPITVILQNQTIESNGFVQLAPRRSEFFTIPGQEFDYQDWLNSLAIHELRHVVQFDKLSGNLKAPFFEKLGLAFFGISLPPWFFEGDAVITETILSPAGRGRQPSWEMPFRANVLNERNFSYSKNFLGSFKDRTPGYYPLGYFMVAKLRRDYGAMILDTLMRDVSKTPLRPYNLSKALKYHTGMSTRQLHDSTVAELRTLWQSQLEQTQTTLYPGINMRKDTTPKDYLLPQKAGKNLIIALKHSKVHTPAIVSLNEDDKEKILLKIGIQQEPNLSYAAGNMVWDELREDIRFDKRSFSVICTYNLQNKRYHQITHHSRYFSPALSPDGKKIAVIHVDYSNHMTIVELDAKSGKEIARYTNPDQSILQTPQYHQSGQKIVYLRVNQTGKAIEELDLNTRETRIKLFPQKQLLSRPCYAGDDILFKAHYNGIDNIYQLSDTEGVKQLTASNYGAFYPNFNQETETLLFSDYHLNGYDIISLPQSEWLNTPISETKSHFINYAEPLAAQEDPIDFNGIPKEQKASKPYRTFTHLLNFHSLEPSLSSHNFSDDWNIGLKALSSNLLNTLDFYAGYNYNTGLQSSEYIAGFNYKALYPIISLNYSNKARRAGIDDNGTPVVLNWREQETELSISIPVRFNYLNQHAGLGLEIASSYTSRHDILSNPANYTIPAYLAFPMRYGFYFGQNSRMSNRDLAPKWGSNFRLDYQYFPFDKRFNGQQVVFQSIFFSPGILKNHSFSAGINTQHSDGDYVGSNDIPMVSGYYQLQNDPLLPPKNTVLLDYKFPLAYPDWEIGALAYVKRLRAGFFADFENFNFSHNNTPRTFGFELSADLNLFRFYLPDFNAGGKVIFSSEKLKRNPIFEFGLTYSY